MDRIYQIQRYIGELMRLTSKTKMETFAFIDGIRDFYLLGVSNAESRLYLFSALELIALFFVSIMQIRYVMNLFSKTSGVI